MSKTITPTGVDLHGGETVQVEEDAPAMDAVLSDVRMDTNTTPRWMLEDDRSGLEALVNAQHEFVQLAQMKQVYFVLQGLNCFLMLGRVMLTMVRAVPY